MPRACEPPAPCLDLSLRASFTEAGRHAPLFFHLIRLLLGLECPLSPSHQGQGAHPPCNPPATFSIQDSLSGAWGLTLWHTGLSTSGLFWCVVVSGCAGVFFSECWTRVSFQSGAKMGAEHEGKSQGLLAGEGKAERNLFPLYPVQCLVLSERNKLISWWVIALLPLRRQEIKVKLYF